MRPPFWSCLSEAPPKTPIVEGNHRPVALPVAAEASAPKPHWMPTSRDHVDRASTTRASIWICGVWVSSRWSSRTIRSRCAAMSVTMTLFVRPSTWSLPFGDRSGRTSSTAVPATA